MLIIYTPERAEKLVAQYEKMRWFSVQRTLCRVPTDSRTYNGIRVDRGVYARVHKKGRLHLVVEHEWINAGSVLL